MLQMLSPNGPIGRILTFFLDALLICLAWAVCSIPVVTIGASTAAVHRVALNRVRDTGSFDVKSYFRAFRENLRGATAVWLILLLPLAMILYNGYLTFLSAAPTPEIMQWMFFLTAFVWSAIAVYAFALQATFENKPLRTIGNALRIAMANLTATVGLILLFALVLLATLLFPYAMAFYTPMGIILSARLTWRVFQRAMEMTQAQSGKAEEHKGEDV